MFKKKQKVTKETAKTTEETIEVTSKDISETLNKFDQKKQSKTIDRDSPSAFFNLGIDQEEKIYKEVKKQVTEPKLADGFQWANNPEYEAKLEKENKKKKRKKRGKEVEEEPTVTEQAEETEEKKDIRTYFEENQKNNKKLRKGKKEEVIEQPEESNKKKKKKRKSKKEKMLEDIKDQKLFRFNNKKFTKVEDFITYLNEHYLDIDDIAVEILEDENFFGWINKNSGKFQQSLQEFKELKKKIEKKS